MLICKLNNIYIRGTIMNLITTSFWQGISSMIKILVGFITMKFIAIYLGPVGVAIVGNFTNITSIFINFANGGITSGITKYIAEYEDNEIKQKEMLVHSIKINLFCSIIITIFVCLFYKFIAKLVFGDYSYSSVILIFGLTIIFYGINITSSAVLNGYKKIKYLIISNIFGSCITCLSAIIIVMKFKIYGALIYGIIAQIFVFFINIYLIKKINVFKISYLKLPLHKDILWKFFKYSIMGICSIIMSNLSTYLIRNNIFSNVSKNEAGYIQGLWSISAGYLSIITLTLSTYYLPTFSSIKDKYLLKQEIMRAYKFLLPILTIGCITIFLAKDIIIKLLFTSAFLEMRKYFLFQLIGDFFKICTWILSFFMIAKAMTKKFIASEIIFSIMYVVLSFIFIKYFGSIGITYAYTITYISSFIYLFFIIKDFLVN